MFILKKETNVDFKKRHRDYKTSKHVKKSHNRNKKEEV